MPPVGFEPTISAGERPQTYALDRAAIGTGSVGSRWTKYEHGAVMEWLWQGKTWVIRVNPCPLPLSPSNCGLQRCSLDRWDNERRNDRSHKKTVNTNKFILYQKNAYIISPLSLSRKKRGLTGKHICSLFSRIYCKEGDTAFRWLLAKAYYRCGRMEFGHCLPFI